MKLQLMPLQLRQRQRQVANKASLEKYFLFLLQVVAHLSIVPMILYGTWYYWVLALVVYFFTGCFGMTMTFHRLLSHRSWEPPKWFYYFGTLCGAYGLTGSPLAWVAVHREHHRHADTEKDPHSPHNGFIQAQWLSMFHPVNPKYAVDMARDPFQLFVHQHYYRIHLSILIGLLLINPMLAVAGYLFPAALLWNMGSGVNTFGHLMGYRTYETRDDSRNNPFFGYLLWGEGWHNNHHAKPMDRHFRHKWWELDVGGLFISLLETKKPDEESY